MITMKLKADPNGFSEKEIKRAKKGLKKAGVPKEYWYIDTLVGESGNPLVRMFAPELYTTVRYYL